MRKAAYSLVFLATFFFYSYSIALAAIAPDNNLSSGTACAGSGSPCTINMTIGGSSDTSLVCQVDDQNGNNSIGVTANGTPLTHLDTETTNLGFYLYSFEGDAIPAGATAISYSFSGSNTNGVFLNCASYTGSGGVDAHGTQPTSAVNIFTGNITNSFANDWIWWGVYAQPSSGSYTGVSNAFLVNSAGGANAQVFDTGGAMPSGSNSMSVKDGAATQNWSGVMVSLKPTGAPPAPPSGGLLDLINYVHEGFASTTGFSMASSVEWLQEGLIRPFMGGGLAVLYFLRYWIAAFLVIGGVIFFAFRAFRFFRH